MDKDFLERNAMDYALEWRNRLGATTTELYVRRLILQRAAMEAVSQSLDCKCSYRVELALALWLCERVEQRALSTGES